MAQGSSPKEDRDSPEVCREYPKSLPKEITRKKTGGLDARLPKVAGVCGSKSSGSGGWTARTIESRQRPAGVDGYTTQMAIGPPVPQITGDNKRLTAGIPPVPDFSEYV
ncbi:hypothetical protein BHE74_00053431 [Ensete ventricosum]|nr:hypothetical protein BHE74_00053431 [Ensete ventricosum]RZS22620.1 hypothetical protein BHM03_00055424 [Ensete ventricosum]